MRFLKRGTNARGKPPSNTPLYGKSEAESAAPWNADWLFCPKCRPYVYGNFTDIFKKNFSKTLANRGKMCYYIGVYVWPYHIPSQMR